MKRAVILAIFVTSSALWADDAGDDQTPVTTITPVVTDPVSTVIPGQTNWTIQPVVITLLDVLASPAPSPAQIQALVAQLTPDQIASVAIQVMKNPTAYSAFIAQLTTDQILSVVSALQDSPAAISALAATMTVDQAAKVVAALASDSVTLSVVLSQMDPEKLSKVKIDLFLTDLDGWTAVSNFLNQPPPKKPFANWLATERAALAARIARDGYTPALLSEVQKLMNQATK